MKFLIGEYKEELLNIDINFPYKREMFDFLKEKIKNTNICLVGLRQVGKTTLMLQIAKWYFENIIKKDNDESKITNALYDDDKIFYTNLKSIQNINFDENRELLLKEVTNKKYKLIVLDEIQEINEWANFVQIAIDLNKDARFIISGSNATSLNYEIIVGRIKVFFVNPLLFNEYKTIWNDNTDYNIENYLKYGSYPKNKNYSHAYIQYKELVSDNVIDKIINEDKQKNIDQTKFYCLLANINNYIGNEINYSKLENDNISRQTVSTYLKIMQNAKLIHLVPKYQDKNISRKNKIYYEDKSMIYLLNNFEKLNNNLTGSLIENIIFNYLKYKFENSIGMNEIFYFRDQNNGKEIDFVIPSKKIIIECKYSNEIEKEKIIKQMCENNQFNDYKKIVVTKNFNDIDTNVEFVSLDRILESKYEW